MNYAEKLGQQAKACQKAAANASTMLKNAALAEIEKTELTPEQELENLDAGF